MHCSTSEKDPHHVKNANTIPYGCVQTNLICEIFETNSFYRLYHLADINMKGKFQIKLIFLVMPFLSECSHTES